MTMDVSTAAEREQGAIARSAIKERLQGIDWGTTSLGPRSTWPLALEHALQVCLDAVHPTFIFWGPDFIQFYNAPAVPFCGARHPHILGLPAREAWPDIWHDIEPQLERVFRTGETILSDNVSLSSTNSETVWGDRFFTYAYSPIRDNEKIVGVLNVVIETTDAVRYRQESTAIAKERAILAEASRRLAESLDMDETLRLVAQLVVPDLGDWCQIDVRSQGKGVKTIATAHRDPIKARLLKRIVGKTHLNVNAQHGTPYAIRTGKTDIITDFSLSDLKAIVDDEHEAVFYQKLGVRSVVTVPLVADGDTFGAVSVVYGQSSRQHTESDVSLLQQLAGIAGVAMRNARLFEREHKTAESFQEASLPKTLPRVAGFSFDAMYQAGRTGGVVGGDWYDAVRLFDGRIVISIGDVAGSGLEAAVTMGNIRQIVRGIAQVYADPVLILDAADRALRLEHPDVYVTAFVCVLDPISRTFTYASAGHPPPMLRLPTGEVVLLSDGGLPLGIRHGCGTATPMPVDFPPGAQLVLYTDGLTEYRRDVSAGEDRLRDLLATTSFLTLDNPAAQLKEQFLADVQTSDDIAILIVTAEVGAIAEVASSPYREWTFEVTDADAAQLARHAFCAELRSHGAPLDAIASAELIFGELVGNVMRYAPGPVQIIIDWSTNTPVLHVLDKGPGFRHVPILPSDVYAESGRGLYLVSTLTEEFHVLKRPHGGSHARAVLAMN